MNAVSATVLAAGLLLLPAAALAATEWPDVPADTEGPPWGDRRLAPVSVRAGVEGALPLWGESGGSAAPHAPPYAEGWEAGIGGAIDLNLFPCPEYSLFLTVERFSFPSAGPETVGTDTYEFGGIGGTALAVGFGVHLPVGMPTELWLCTVAPPVLGPVLYASIGAGAAMLDELSLEVLPVPAGGNPPWWESSAAPFGCVRIGIEYRFLKLGSLFVEAAGGAFLPEGGPRPGAGGATAFAYAGVRGGLALFLF